MLLLSQHLPVAPPRDLLQSERIESGGGNESLPHALEDASPVVNPSAEEELLGLVTAVSGEGAFPPAALPSSRHESVPLGQTELWKEAEWPIKQTPYWIVRG